MKIYEGEELDSFEEWIQEITTTLAIFEKVLKRLNKRRDNSTLYTKELQGFFGGLDLDLFDEEDDKTMYSVNDIIN